MESGKSRTELAGTRRCWSLAGPGTRIHLAHLGKEVTQSIRDIFPLIPCVEQLPALLEQNEGEGGLRRGGLCGGGNLHEVLE